MSAMMVMVVAGMAGVASVQPGAEAPATPNVVAEPGKERVRFAAATRADLGLAYLRLERAWAKTPPRGERVAAMNRVFDQASLSFFSGRFNNAVKALGEMVRELEGLAPTAALLAAESVRVTPAAAVIHPGNRDAAKVEIEPLFAIDGPGGDARLVLRRPDGTEAWSSRVVLAAPAGGAGVERAVVPIAFEEPGDYAVALAGDGWAIEKARLSIAEASVGDVGRSALAALEQAGGGVVERAAATARARAKLLTDQASGTASAQFLGGLRGLARAVEAEVREVREGKNPYAGRAGDHWRVVRVNDADVPCRVFVPEGMPKGPRPLLLAYHGAGGDENMFFEGYGAGSIKELAQKEGWIVASPLTYSGSSGRAFDRIVEDLSADYEIDTTRVYLIGHSMGAGAVSGLAASRADRVAGVVCLAGGGGFGRAKALPPVLVIGAELDPLFSIERLERAASEAKEAGLPVEFRRLDDYGQTMMVGRSLPEAFAWLGAKGGPKNDDADR